MLQAAALPQRGTDPMGSGHYGASRGSRTHNGVDYACYPETEIASPTFGTVTKLGYPYGDDLSYRYVEITDQFDKRHRVFYVEPSVQVGSLVHIGDVIGTAQDIEARYSGRGMKNHVHYEIKLEDGSFIDPES